MDSRILLTSSFYVLIVLLLSLSNVGCFNIFRDLKKFMYTKQPDTCDTTSNIPNISSPSREDVSHSLTTEEMHQDQLLLSNQTTTSSAKIRLETEQTTNAEEMHLSSQEDTPWEKNRVLVLCIIGLSCITVVMACLHIVWCVVDVLFM
nr:uncharacterized protein LOC105328254 isoform X4 [Crassostrea gigas]